MTEILAFLARTDLDGRPGGPALIWAVLAGIAFLVGFLLVVLLIRALRFTVIHSEPEEPEG